MTIGRERYGNMDRPYIRRGLAYLGLALIASAIPTALASRAIAVSVAAVGGYALIYALLPSSYPMLGVIGSVALASVALAIGLWLSSD